MLLAMTLDELHRQVELLRNMVLQSHHLDNTRKEVVENLLQRVQDAVIG